MCMIGTYMYLSTCRGYRQTKQTNNYPLPEIPSMRDGPPYNWRFLKNECSVSVYGIQLTLL